MQNLWLSIRACKEYFIEDFVPKRRVGAFSSESILLVFVVEDARSVLLIPTWGLSENTAIADVLSRALEHQN